MSYPSQEEILLSSKAWIASLLNFLPGLGSGYLYQRRWIPYFLTICSFFAWLFIGFILEGGKDPTQKEQFIGISGIFLISIVTTIEANITYKKVLNKVLYEKKKANPSLKKSWFN